MPPIWEVKPLTYRFQHGNFKNEVQHFQFHKQLTPHTEISFVFKFRFPFDTKNPIGYLTAAFIEYIITIYYFSFAIFVVSYAFTTFFFVVLLTEDATDVANSLYSSAVNTNDLLQTRKQLAEFIRIYSTSKQLSDIQCFF